MARKKKAGKSPEKQGRARPRKAPAASRKAAEPEAPPAPPPSEQALQQAEDDLLPILEAMLFAAHEPLSVQRMAASLGKVRRSRVQETLETLERLLVERRSPLQLVEIAGGFRLVTRPEFAPYLSRLFHKAEKERLSPAALETLAIIAYHQPVTRADIEAIRGVQAGPVVRVLQDRRLVKVVGRAAVLGRPQQFGTTRRFLDHFGLNGLKDLPQVLGQDGRPVLVAGMPLPGAADPPEDDADAPEPAVEGAADAAAPEATGVEDVPGAEPSDDTLVREHGEPADASA